MPKSLVEPTIPGVYLVFDRRTGWVYVHSAQNAKLLVTVSKVKSKWVEVLSVAGKAVLGDEKFGSRTLAIKTLLSRRELFQRG